MRHVNIPVFIPHLGCPNQCVFCNQRFISGVQEFRAADLSRIIDEALSTISPCDEVEIAFFGGSFTGIDRDLMIDLLKIASSYISDGRVSALRCSTRPDYINEEVLDILSLYGMKTIELGLQSVSEDVLALSKRGHGFQEEKTACKLIVSRGFSLVGQMMIGLPGSTPESEEKTADFIISSGALGARIYPTVVFRDTELCEMALSGVYEPLSVEQAIKRSAAVMKKFIKANVDVIRVGLCSSENLSGDETYYDGPNHPALGELVENELYFELIKDKLSKVDPTDKKIIVSVARGNLSKAIGHKKKNKLRLKNELLISNIDFCESEELSKYDLIVSVQER